VNAIVSRTVKQVTFRFYGPLNDFRPADERQKPIVYPIFGRQSLKDAVESLGIPHTEVQLALVNGQPVGWEAHLNADDYVSIYPHFHSVSLDAAQALYNDPEGDPRFVLDAHLGRLAKLLRMLGLDAYYRNDYQDHEIAAISASTGRIVLTRDRKLLMRNEIRNGYYVRNTDPNEQAAEILRRYRLREHIRPLTRCLECNAFLVHLPGRQVKTRIPVGISSRYDEFVGCDVCGRVYWKGSHYDRMVERIVRLMEQTENS
jgi:uncharacterized protein with PIN domain/sulfur carrier protein ThiS